MPSFPTDYNTVIKVLAPYHQAKRPLDFFFEMYVVDVIEELPQETKAAFEDFSKRHPTFFASHKGHWREFVVRESKLSDTIEIAIWDLWIRNSTNAQNGGWKYHPWHFAQDFSRNYFAEGSRVDVWDGNALEDARNRIEVHRR
ncbi:MAG: hypothetical protein ACK56I_17275, partial [bacterium]